MRSINPGLKLLALLIVSLELSVTYDVAVNLAVGGIALLLAVVTPGVDRRRLALALVPFALAVAAFFTTGLIFGASHTDVAVDDGLTLLGQGALVAHDYGAALRLSSRIVAYGGVGLLFAFTTRAFDLVMSLMQQFRLPPQFAYGILAAYHFFPVVRDEYATVKIALAQRGVRASGFSGKRLVPMIAHALERSEGIAMAMESRGFDGSAPRACAFRVPVRARDIAFAVAVPLGVLAALVLVP